MTPPKPPRDDDRPTPPLGAARQRFPSPVKGSPVIEERSATRAATERERDRYLPKSPNVIAQIRPGHPESWDDQTPANISDPETYRKVRELQLQTAQQDLQIAVVVTEVGHLKKEVSGISGKLDKVNDSLVRVATIVEADRERVTVTETKMIATQTASTQTKETLAEQVLSMDREARKLRYRFWGKLGVAALSGGGVIALIIAAISARC